MTTTWQVAVRNDYGKANGVRGNTEFGSEAAAIHYAKTLVKNLADKMPSTVQEVTVLKAPYGTWWSEFEKWTFVTRTYSRDGLAAQQANPKDVLPAAKKLAARFGMTPEELAKFLLENN